MKKIKKIVLVGHNISGSYIIASEIIKQFNDIEFQLVITQGIYYNKTFFQSIAKLLKEASFIFVAWRAIELLRFKLSGKGLKKLAQENNFIHFTTNDINSKETLSRIRSFEPDLLVSCYTMHIYKSEILKIAKYNSITAHPSKIPSYRGLEVFFWQIANNEKYSAVSVFQLTPSIDIGNIYWCKEFIIDKQESVAKFYIRITRYAVNGLIKVINMIENNNLDNIESNEKGSYFPMPTRKCFRRFIRNGKKLY